MLSRAVGAIGSAPHWQCGGSGFESRTVHVIRSEYDLARYHSRREGFVARLGGKCVDCDGSEDLEFDHVDPKTKSFNVGEIILHGDDKVLAEMTKCVLRCKSCHKVRSDVQQSVGHGGGLTGVKNCRCELCGPLKNQYMRDLRAKRKMGD